MQQHHQLGLRRTEVVHRIRRGHWISRILPTGSRLRQMLSYIHMLFFMKSKRGGWKRAQNVKLEAMENYSQALRAKGGTSNVCLLDFKIVMDQRLL